MKAGIRIAAVAAACALAGCASYTDEYQQRLVRALASPGPVTFEDSRAYPGRVLCGSYTSFTIEGYSTVTRDYVVTPTRVMTRPREDEKAVFCSDDPAAALFAAHGIGGPDADWMALAKIRDDMRAIDSAIVRYHSSTQMMPFQLTDLLTGDYGIGPDQLMDPREQPYVYEPGLAGRTTPQYELRSDGAAGAAIAREHIDMLDHVLTVRAR